MSRHTAIGIWLHQLLRCSFRTTNVSAFKTADKPAIVAAHATDRTAIGSAIWTAHEPADEATEYAAYRAAVGSAKWAAHSAAVWTAHQAAVGSAKCAAYEPTDESHRTAIRTAVRTADWPAFLPAFKSAY